MARDEWQRNILSLSDFARNDLIPLVLVGVSALLLLKSLLLSGVSHKLQPEGTTSQLSIPYEVCSQMARAVTFVAATISVSRHHSEWTAPLLFGYVFVLGLLALIFRTTWRKTLLRHVDILVIVSFVLILISDNLPRALVQYSTQTEPPRVLLSSALGFCVLILAFTPQEWTPPSVSLDLVHRDKDEGPSPEESCSYFSYYVSYGWLTNVIFKGLRGTLTLGDLPSLPFYDEPLHGSLASKKRVPEDARLCGL